jgi:RNA polymerase sigma-70 factor (ECF subfamily)
MVRTDPAFEMVQRERPYLLGLAYRLLGSHSDAEDVVQEALLRAVDNEEELRSVRAFLTTVVTRLCLDELGSARRRREHYVGPYLPEPVFTDGLDAGPDPLEHRESVSVALLTLLDQLSPAERAVFVMRDVFDLDYEVIAQALRRSDPSCRKLLQRARARVKDAQLSEPSPPAEQHVVSTAFFHALGSGDLQALVSLLAEEASLCTDHGGKVSAARNTLRGASIVGRFLEGLVRKGKRSMEPVDTLVRYVNGAPGLVLRSSGKVVAVFVLRIAQVAGVARVEAISVMRNPDKLAKVQAALTDARAAQVIAVDPVGRPVVGCSLP